MTDDGLTLTFTAQWHDDPSGEWSTLLIGPYHATAWSGGEWTIRRHGRVEVEAPEFAGGSLATSKAAARAYVHSDHTNRELNTRALEDAR